MIPYALRVDQSVLADVLKDQEVEELGYSSQSNHLNPQVVFASFSDHTLVTYTDYNRVFTKGNNNPLVFPSFGASYPDGSGLGVGAGLKHNTGTLIIYCESAISAIRVKPMASLEVSILSGLNGIEQSVGFTSASENMTCSELSIPKATNFLMLDHIGALDLFEIELFTQELEFSFATFPILQNGKSLPYLVSKLNDLQVTRKGGLKTDRFSIYTVDLSKTFKNTRISYKDVYNISLEEIYSEEASLHEHILRDINALFPILSSIERNCFKHQEMTQSSLSSINKNDAEKLIDLECNIHSELVNGQLFFNGILAPGRLEIFADVKYVFEPESIEISGVNVSAVKLSENENVLFKKNGISIGILNAVKKTPLEIYELPHGFMNDYSLNETLEEIMTVSELLGEFTSSKTPNSGNAVSHAAFIDEHGETLDCEESIFLPGDVRTISVYCSDASISVRIFIDGNEVHITNGRFSIVEVELPHSAGVHSLSTDNGSNVLFRISEKSIVHAPIHPPYYTSGQLERDTFASTTLTFVAQHNNFDLLKDTSMIAKSNSSLVSIQDVEFDDFSCTNALFCRKKAVDLKNPGVHVDTLGSAWDLCSEHPWLACLNVQEGCSIVHSSITLNHFTFLWYPTTTLSDVTIIQGEASVFVRNSKLILVNSSSGYECDIHGIELLSKWNHIAFTNNTFSINGEAVITHQSDNSYYTRVTPSVTVIGTNPMIDLKQLLAQNVSEIQLQEFTRDRLRESEIILQNVDFISSFDMTVLHNDATFSTLTWSNTASGTLPDQRFKLQSDTKPIASILGLTLPHSIPSIELKFTKCGYIKNICVYRHTIPDVVIETGMRNRDTVIDFQTKSTPAICTNEEQSMVKTEHYQQTNMAYDGTFRWIMESVMSSFYVTPPSLIMMSTSQSTPYSTSQSLLILFNRRIEVFLRDDSTLFTITGSDASTMSIKARFCTLLSSQISIQNTFLSLSPGTMYTIHIAKARLFQFEGHVPCLESNIFFHTA